jgi:FKBP-type peptidyl-prolyl cis-trans isomerase SlyD
MLNLHRLEGKRMQIAERTVVTIHYTLTDTQGKVLDTSEGPDDTEPLSYVHGAGMIVPGLEDALMGKSAGDQVKVTIGPEGGYGPREEKLVEKIARSEFPEGDLEIGMHFRAHTPHGTKVLTVVAIDDDTVTVDGNHPLAGATLNFDVKVLSVREATAKDMHGSSHSEHDCSSCHGCGHH